MTNNILFIMLNETGHLIPTYTLADKLKKNGLFNIVYIAGDEMKAEITQRGFHYENDFDGNAVRSIAADSSTSSPKRIATVIRHRLTDIKKNNVEFVAFCRQLIAKYKPQLIFVDDLHFHYRIALHNCTVPLIPLSIVLLSYKDNNIPPPNSTLLPDNTFRNRLLIQLEWMAYFAQRNVREIYYTIRYNGYDYRRRSLARYVKYPFGKRITFKQFYGPGEKTLDKIVMCPPCFDFPRADRTNVHYIESCVDLQRTHNTFNWNAIKNNDAVVLCALGTRAYKHRMICEAFIRNVISVFKRKENLSLIIALGKITDRSRLGDLPDNVYTYECVPQTEVLERSLFMITHGGLGTIKECILMAVPMLVYPVNPLCDQFGNAARVVYHGIGTRGVIRRDDCREIGKNINQMVQNKLFKTNILKIRDKFVAYDKKEPFMHFIDAKYGAALHEAVGTSGAVFHWSDLSIERKRRINHLKP